MSSADLFTTPSPRIFSIAAGAPFLDVLAAAVLRSLGDDPLALSDAVILTPTRRAARSLGEAFLRQQQNARALLLPTLKPLGDFDDDDAMLIEPGDDDIDIPPAISPLKRLVTLAQFVAARNKAFAGQENWPGALSAARELAKLLDSFYAEETPFDRLNDAAPDALARHWALSLEFLSIVTEAWPAYLAANGLMDPTARRAALIDKQQKRWAQTPPEHPIIIAGSTGSAPAVARLIKTVAGLPRGAVVLPGVDMDLDQTGWREIDDPHPQAGLKALLDFLACDRREIIRLSDADQKQHHPARRRLFSVALRPAEASDDWRTLSLALAADDPTLVNATTGLSLIEAANEDDEARAVAFHLRRAIETPGKTALFVTPDRLLAQRTALKMRRWGIVVDDSAGTPFSQSPCGVFLRLVARWRADPADAVALLALIRHPLALFGLTADQRSAACDAMDTALRGLSPMPNMDDPMDGVRRKLAERSRTLDHVRPVLDVLEKALMRHSPVSGFSAQLDAHIQAAEFIAAEPAPSEAPSKAPYSEQLSPDTSSSPLWRGGDGMTGARLLSDLYLTGDVIDGINFGAAASGYVDIFDALIANAVVRAHGRSHPRLAMLGPLEARLQSADLVILGGLNEGVWPAEAAADPFLSRAMRANVGLPSPERRFGLAAHDFFQLATMPEVVLTRAKERDGAPAKPSRWLVRLENILTGAKARNPIDYSAPVRTAMAALDAVTRPTPVASPNPRPPVEARPRDLYVTRINNWLRDPYAIYARYILRLKKLEDPGTAFGMREMGSLLHFIFEVAARDGLPTDGGVASLEELLQRHAPDYGLNTAEAALWKPAIARAFQWFVDFESSQRRIGAPAVLEGVGAHTLDEVTPAFTLRARVDRIDQYTDGRLMIYDYKTGNPPTAKQGATFSPQLPLTALIAAQGGFSHRDSSPLLGPLGGYYYLRILNRDGKSSENEKGNEGEAAGEAVDDAKQRLVALITAFDDPATPYRSQPHPEFTDQFGDYDQLARRREWGGRSDGDDG